MPVSLILINTPSLCSTSLQLTMLKGMVPLCGIGLRVHCFSKIKRLYFRELFLGSGFVLQSLLCSVFPYCRRADTENSKRGSLCQLNRYYLFIYLFIALRTLRASVSKTLGAIRQILQNTLSQPKCRGWGRSPLGFFSIHLWG